MSNEEEEDNMRFFLSALRGLFGAQVAHPSTLTPLTRADFEYQSAVPIPATHQQAIDRYFVVATSFHELEALQVAATRREAEYVPVLSPDPQSFLSFDSFAEAKGGMFALRRIFPEDECGVCKPHGTDGPFRLVRGYRNQTKIPKGYESESHMHPNKDDILRSQDRIDFDTAEWDLDPLWMALPSAQDHCEKEGAHVAQLDGEITRESLGLFWPGQNSLLWRVRVAGHAFTAEDVMVPGIHISPEMFGLPSIHHHCGFSTRVFLKEQIVGEERFFDSVVLYLLGPNFFNSGITKVIFPTSALLGFQGKTSRLQQPALMFLHPDVERAYPVVVDLKRKSSELRATVLWSQSGLPVKAGKYKASIPIDWLDG